jgi:hypothetical protein
MKPIDLLRARAGLDLLEEIGIRYPEVKKVLDNDMSDCDESVKKQIVEIMDGVENATGIDLSDISSGCFE